MPAKRLLLLLAALLLSLPLLLSNLVTAQVLPTLTPLPTVPPPQTPTTTPLPPPLILATLPVTGQSNVTPTPGCAAPLPLSVGALAAVRGGIYVRYQPNGSSPWVNYYSEAVEVTITGGPVCDGVRYNWWQVRGPGNDGWVAEGSPGFYFIRLLSSPSLSACNPAADLNIGGRARLLRDLRVHETASIDGLVLTVAPITSLVDVLEGPVCDGAYNWWRIRTVVLDVTYTGWISDAASDGTPYVEDEFAQDAPVCLNPLRLSVGSVAYVNYRDDELKNLRAAPSEDALLVASLLDGIGFEVIGGPVCTDGMNWWQIRILSRPDVSGWLAEGGPGNYWISPRQDDLNPVPPAPPYQ